MVRLESLLVNGLRNLCGATLIHEYYVVTAAHCVFDSRFPLDSINLYFGKHNLWKKDETEIMLNIPMENIFTHPEYETTYTNNDIALIKLPSSAPISSHVKPICVATQQTVARYQSGTAIGWGKTSNDGIWSAVLKQVNLPIMHEKRCGFKVFYEQTMLCAGNMDGIEESICSGDSGGPLVVNPSRPTLAGITSYSSNKGCVTVGYGVVFTRVSNYINWLYDLMGGELCFA